MRKQVRTCKLALNRETLVALEPSLLNAVAGGAAGASASACCPMSPLCIPTEVQCPPK